MKSYKLTNVSKFTFTVIAKNKLGSPGFIYTINPGQAIDLLETQLSGDVKLKLKKKLLSSVESERAPVTSEFKTTTVKLESAEKPPLSTRGRKKK